MKYRTLLLQSLRHYFKANFWLMLGIALSTAIITGGLIVGDSVKHSLKQTAITRLGNTTHALVSGESFFSRDLAIRLQEKGLETSAALRLNSIAQTDGGELKINKVQLWGIDDNFSAFSTNNSFPGVKGTEQACISPNLAQRLNLGIGDEFQLRVEKVSLLPANTPFVSSENQTITLRVKVGNIVTAEQLGRLNLQNSQTAPYNVFLPIDELNRISDVENKANTLLINTTKSIEDIKQAVRDVYSISDAGLKIIDANATGEWELRSERVFMDKAVEQLVENTDLEYQPLLTYFANQFQANGRQTPYSFVSSLPDSTLNSNEIVVNDWLAADLQLKTGDSLTLTYYEIGPLRELNEVSKKYIVARIEPMNGYFADRLLMPDIPGLSDAENCRDWQTGVPIDLKTIRKTDEEYWYNYKGLPKAFVALHEAQDKWSNRFGNTTAYRFNQENISKEELSQLLSEQIDPFSFDIQLKDVRTDGLVAAENGTDFSSLFIGLSFFILAAGLLLTILLFSFSLEKRNREIGTLSALGFTHKKIKQLFYSEGIILSFIGALIGIPLAIAYNELVFKALNRVWNDIVRTDLLVSYYRPGTLFIGFLASVIVSFATIYFVLSKKLRLKTIQLQRQQHVATSRSNQRIKKTSTALLFAIPLVIFILPLVTKTPLSAGYFFMAGGTILLALLLLFDLLLSQPRASKGKITLLRLAVQNLVYSRNRSLIVIILLTIGTFLVVSTGMNRKDMFATAANKKSGTGGFLFWAEATMPILHNLNDVNYRKEQGFSENFSVLAMSAADGDDASCLNLNKVSTPRILGVDASMLDGRFTTQTAVDGVDRENPWPILKKDIGECIPVIIDQTVLVWSLGKKVGDTLTYRNSSGNEIKLKLMAGLSASVFQGNVLIDQSRFLENFPTSSGSSAFLIDANIDNQEAIADELNLYFKDNGWEMAPTAERLATFKSIENTYLSIFLALGALGLLIGTIGLAIVLQRSLLSRESEIALLLAVGFPRNQIIRSVVYEYFILLVAGISGGFVSALVSVWPTLTGNAQSISVGFVALLLGIIFLNALFWIVTISFRQIDQTKMIKSLRNE
jgi:ABC-type antimicrobial peptide transport system permease subunit